MQQHLMQMQPMMAAYASPNQVTTDVIQQYLDENKQLILAILDNQNSGKADECAENQAKLQRNLMYLAAIADSQSQAPNLAQYPPNVVMQSGQMRYMPHQQGQQMTPQSLMGARSPMMYPQSSMSAMHHQQQQQQQQQQAVLHSQLAMSAGGPTGFGMLHGESGGSGGGGGQFPDFSRGGRVSGKQDGSSSGGQCGGDDSSPL